MTNEFKQDALKIAKVLFVLLLLFIGILVFNTFVRFSSIEKRLDSGDIDFENPVTKNEVETEPENNQSEGMELIAGDGSNYSLGAKIPKVIIVEFADFACPYCKKSFSTIREISIKYNKDVKYIYRDMPIVTENSIFLAMAARCAGEQGLFWQMHDKLFLNQGKTTKKELIELAKQAGVETKKFEECFDSQKYLNAIKKDYNDAVELGIDQIGTPVWYINGHQVSGNIPEETFTKIIESILK